MEWLSTLLKENKALALLAIGGMVLVGCSVFSAYLAFAWWLFAVRTFGAPMPDYPAWLGLVMLLAPLVFFFSDLVPKGGKE